jgi:peptide/nickel transport system substrate-binding protein
MGYNQNLGISRGVLVAVVVAVVVVAVAGGLVGYYVTHPPTKTVTVSTATTVTTTAVTTTATTVTTTSVATTTVTPIPMAQTVQVMEVQPSLVPQYLQTDQIDLFLNPFAIPSNIFQTLTTIPGVSLVSPAVTGADDLLFNPYPSNTTFNPFAYWQFRFLMNYLVDRSYAVNQVFHGFATPMLAWPYVFGIYSYLLILPKIVKYNIHYDPAYVNASIFALFQQINATDPVWKHRILYINHQWYYIPPNSTTPKPVTILFFIRNDDPYRMAMGNAFASALESLGFTVQTEYGPGKTAIPLVYSSNPANMEWQIYTEGWVITPESWDTGAGAGFCASWADNMPGWGVSGYWQYTNSTIDLLTYQVSEGNFTSMVQFENISKITLFDCFQQAVRVWQVANSFPYPVLSSVNNYMPSIFGLEWPLGTKFAYSTLHPDTLKVGMLHVTVQDWNTYNWYVQVWLYDVDVLQGWVGDPFAGANPFSGEPMPLRGGWYVELSPNGSAIFPVPPNAVIWNATLDKWVDVGPGQYAKAVVYLYFNGTWIGQYWQDGQPITMADIIFYYYTWFDLYATTTGASVPDLGPHASALSDIGSALSSLVPTIVGMQFFPNGTVVIYGDYWFPDPNFVASSYAPGFPTFANPWVIQAVQLYAFAQGKYAFSSGEAQSLNIPQLDLRSPSDNAYLASVIKNWLSTGYVWDNGSWAIINGYNFLNSSMVTEAYEDALNFYNTYGNLFISNGPYILKNIVTVTPQSATLVRWSGYPYNYTYWFNQIYGRLGVTTLPPGGNLVPKVTLLTPTSITIGQPATFNITAYNPVGIPEARVYLISPSGVIVFSGAYNGTAVGFSGFISFTIPASVTSTLTPGTYTLIVLYSTSVVPIPSQYTASITVSS